MGLTERSWIEAANLNPTHGVKFHDFDNEEVYDEIIEHAGARDARNFVVQFGNGKAQIARDLSPDEVEGLLKKPSFQAEDCYPVRWINIWTPHDSSNKQKECVTRIGEHYQFSKRLMAVQTAPKKPLDDAGQKPKRSSSSTLSLTGKGGRKRPHDAESRYHGPPSSTTDYDPSLVSVYLKDTMNYNSTDYGEKFFCVGTNWLHQRPNVACKVEQDTRFEMLSLVPPKHWSWIIICDDNPKVKGDGSGAYYTVISIHEGPWYEVAPDGCDKTAWEEQEVKNMRSNTMSVLRQLSLASEKDFKCQHNILELKTIRSAHGSTQGRKIGKESEMFKLAGTLFYYLFEDYTAAVPVLFKSREMIQELQQAIMEIDKHKIKIRLRSKNIIPLLHDLAKDLRQVKHLFHSYQTIVERILNSRGPAGSSLGALGSACHLDETPLWNLMAQKDSEATALLTRSATLLAKLSVFFLPISVQTSFFSVEVNGMLDTYTPRHYWISFGIIAGLSFLSLFFFSRFLIVLSEFLDCQVGKIIDAAKERYHIMVSRLYGQDNDSPYITPTS